MSDYKLYTVTCDYFATGEGIHYFVVITRATDEDAARKIFVKEFGSYYSIDAKVVEGIPDNNTLIPPMIRERLPIIAEDGYVFFKTYYHVNFS